MIELLKDPRCYVNHYINTNGITVDERGVLVSASGKKNEEIFDTMYLDYIAIVGVHNATQREKAPGFRKNVSAISEKLMSKALHELIVNKKISHRAEVINSLKCVTPSNEIVTNFIKALTGGQDAADIAVISHWLWSVKKKMAGQSPSYHIMPILFGKQEGGKTVALNKLIAPINNFRLNIGMDDMADGRYFKSMSENYVIVFDEMQGAVRTDIDALKKQVTIDENDYRPLGTNDVFKVRQSCSFIGATNRSVAEQIVDVTGMRRFYELHCQDKLDWDLLGSIDFLAMWQSIDETKENGYMLEQIDNIRKKQECLVASDEITSFMEDRGLVVGKNPTKRVSTGDLFILYKEWAQDNGFQIKTINWFSRALSGKGFVKGKHRVGNKTANYFEVNTDYSEAFVPLNVNDSDSVVRSFRRFN